MRKLPLALLLLAALSGRCQEADALYVFNADWKPTKLDSAHFLLHVHQVSDSCWQWDYYNFVGPILKSEQYADREGHEINGITRVYNTKGLLDSSVTFKKGKMDGDAYRFEGDSIHMKMKYVYRDDSLISVIDPTTLKKNPNGDSVEKESEYPGGVAQWLRFLNKHLKYPERAVNGNFEGVVRVLFIVGKEGEVLDPVIGRSVEFSLDEESLRIIRASGKWTPATQFGKQVKTYKIQPIVFRLE